MAGQALPIRLQEVLQLPSLGINPNAITFANLTMESEKFICVREEGEQVQIVIIDLANPQALTRRPISADAAIMNPTEKLLALKAGNALQIFNIDQKVKVKAVQMHDNVVFWKWVSSRTLALVTATAVYHWYMDNTADPQKVFDRHPSLASAQIINYRADAAEKWLCLVGIAQGADGKIAGAMQLYNVDKGMSQPIEGHACSFTKFTVPGASAPSTLFSFTSRGAAGAKLHVIEVTKGSDTAPPFQKAMVDVYYPPEGEADFPVAMQISEKYGVIYMVTKFGYVHLYDVETGACIYMNRISADTIFVTAPLSTGGILGVNRKGQVLSLTVDENTIVQYVCTNLNNVDLGIRLAGRANLPGASDLFERQFDNLLRSGDVKAASLFVFRSGQALRTQATIQKFQHIPVQPGQPSALLLYFSTLLEAGKLNKTETLELGKLVLQQQRPQMIEKWLKEDKLECSEEFGDLVGQVDANLALSIYLRANVPHKVINAFLTTGAYDKILLYAQKVGHKPDYGALLQNIVARNLKGALDFALMLAQVESGPLVDYSSVVDVFTSRNMVQEATSFLLDVLKKNKPEEGYLQTRLLEINLMAYPQVADAILSNNMFTHYDKERIASLCEKAGLFQRALEHYGNIADIKRVVHNTHAINPEFLVTYFGTLSVEYGLECLKEMLVSNMRQNLQVVVSIATKYSEQLTPDALTRLFEENRCVEGLYFYLGSIVNFSQDPEVHFKYIEASCKTGQLKEVERVTRESEYYPAERTKDFLKEAKLADPRPLINVCDRYDYVEELTQYLYKNNMIKYIEVYVQKVNPARTPKVVGALLDHDCAEDIVKKLVMTVGPYCPCEQLVEECETRNRLKLVLPWLEARYNEGNQDSHLHDALAKIYIDTGRDPEKFLETNRYYDSRVIGRYCEKRDPHLSVLAYKRGLCDDELVDVTNRNGLFRQQARYLVERQDLNLWSRVLVPDNEHRKALIDQVVGTALPESQNSEEVSTTVKAFMTADLPHELLELLEKIVLQSTNFSDNKNLQNLLIITAIKTETQRVMDYIKKLDNFDGPQIAGIAIDAGLHEEGFVIYKKFDQKVEAIGVLLNNIGDLGRGYDFAKHCNDSEVWSVLARAQLDGHHTTEAIDSYIKANDASNFVGVISCAERDEKFAELIKYLIMARKKGVKDAQIDSTLILAYAKTNRLSELEEFISGPNVAKIQAIGDRCYDDGFYEAARLLFTNISNFSRLASALVKLLKFQDAVEAARKANSTRTWKEVLESCVDHAEFRLAQMCGLQIIMNADEIEEVVRVYEVRGYFEELLQLMESGLGLEMGAGHTGIFTELGVLYSKYKPDKLMEHLKLFWSRCNLPRLIRAAERARMWNELTFTYVHYDEFDNAAHVMIDHSADAWDHTSLKDVIVKVNNSETYYKAIRFYREQQPQLLNDILNTLVPKLDHARVVDIMERFDCVALVKGYLQGVQKENIAEVNEALNALYVEEEDYDALRASINKYKTFDQIGLAERTQKHELMEFRRIAADLYKMNARFDESIELSKQDKLYKDAMETAAASKHTELCEKLLQFFVDENLNSCFGACLFMCYDYVRSDVVLELSWRHGILDFAMPYFVQFIREYVGKVDTLWDERHKAIEQKEKDRLAEEQMLSAGVDPSMGMGGPLALGYDPGYGMQQGYDPSMAYGHPGMAHGGMAHGYGHPGGY